MIVVTGGAGFIGSALVRSLVADGTPVTVVDDVRADQPGQNLHGIELADHFGQDEFLTALDRDPTATLDGIDAVLHQGACTSTVETDLAFLDRNNTAWSVALLKACDATSTPLIYASSAAVYGHGPSFSEDADNDRPLNGYAQSKARFDAHVRETGEQRTSQVVGLRYFNVYGPGERHKGAMASMVPQWFDQIGSTGQARVFGTGAGADAGAHRRDFIHVDDVVAVVRWFLDRPDRSGLFNCGTGASHAFDELAATVIDAVGRGEIVHVPFPTALEPTYQAHTRADLTRLRATGCDVAFEDLASGVERYVAELRADRS